MAITHTIQNTWSSNAGGTLTGSIANSGTDESNLSLAMLASQTDTVQAFSIQTLTLVQKSVYIMSTVACTVKFYAGAILKTTMTLTANVPVVYQGSGTAPIASDADITQIKYTTTDAGQLDIRVLLNAT